jgi:archaemetzincin
MVWFGEARRLYILPLGRLTEALLQALKEALEKVYPKPVTVLQAQALPLYAYDRAQGQCRSGPILQRLARLRLDGLVLAVMDGDLYTPGMHFIFGEADPEEGVAVVALARLKEEFHGAEANWPLLLQRAQKEAVHEVGHLFGLSHCPDKACVMYFSSTLKDTDRKEPWPCPRCAERLKHSE